MRPAEVLSIERCRERIAYWQRQLEVATARRPHFERVGVRERVVSTCVARINAWHQRLVALRRLAGEKPEEAA